MLGLLEVEYKGAGRADRQREGVHRKALEALHPKLLAEFLVCGFVDESPFVDGGNVVVAETLFDSTAHGSVHDELFGLEARQQRAYVVQATLGYLEGAG